jgi:hypothetical protein
MDKLLIVALALFSAATCIAQECKKPSLTPKGAFSVCLPDNSRNEPLGDDFLAFAVTDESGINRFSMSVREINVSLPISETADRLIASLTRPPYFVSTVVERGDFVTTSGITGLRFVCDVVSQKNRQRTRVYYLFQGPPNVVVTFAGVLDKKGDTDALAILDKVARSVTIKH